MQFVNDGLSTIGRVNISLEYPTAMREHAAEIMGERWWKSYVVADLYSKILDAPGPILIVIQFSAKFGQIIGWFSPSPIGIGAPSRLGIPGSAAVM